MPSDVVAAQGAGGHVPAHLAKCVVLVISSDQLAAAGITAAFSVAHCYTSELILSSLCM